MADAKGSTTPSSPALHPQTNVFAFKTKNKTKLKWLKIARNEGGCDLPVRNKRHVAAVAADGGGDVVAVDDDEDCAVSKDRANWTKRPRHRHFRAPHRRLSNRMSRPFQPQMSRPRYCWLRQSNPPTRGCAEPRSRHSNWTRNGPVTHTQTQKNKKFNSKFKFHVCFSKSNQRRIVLGPATHQRLSQRHPFNV